MPEKTDDLFSFLSCRKLIQQNDYISTQIFRVNAGLGFSWEIAKLTLPKKTFILLCFTKIITTYMPA
jgi:hypothetical protein